MAAIYWLASYPKSGNTWLRMWLAWLLAEADAPGEIEALDAPIASSRDWLDTTLGFPTADLDPDEIDRLRPAVYDWRGSGTATRFHKTHDAYVRLADGGPLLGRNATRGAVYVVRNPLDVVLSYAAHSGRTVDRVIDYMADPTHAHNAHPDRLGTQVRQRFLSWSGHVTSWTHTSAVDTHVVRYEDMHAAPDQVLTAIARFLRLPDDVERVARAVRQSRFDRLQARETRSGFGERPPGMAAFFRTGRVGTWRDQLTPQQVARVVADHAAVMQRFGYLDAGGDPA